ncbi:MAG: DUF2442 domain-containing protein [Lentisphaerae bacterium]|nr:DUF2442 domain-containing protein [Lentisphaerota bacterium]
MHKITQVEVLEGYRLKLCFADGTTGEVVLSDLSGCGVFAPWVDYAEFRKVAIGDSGELVWSCGVDLCPDALYFKITGKKPEEEFPPLQPKLAHA